MLARKFGSKPQLLGRMATRKRLFIPVSARPRCAAGDYVQGPATSAAVTAANLPALNCSMASATEPDAPAEDSSTRLVSMAAGQ